MCRLQEPLIVCRLLLCVCRILLCVQAINIVCRLWLCAGYYYCVQATRAAYFVLCVCRLQEPPWLAVTYQWRNVSWQPWQHNHFWRRALGRSRELWCPGVCMCVLMCICEVGQNCIYSLYMTVYLVVSLPQIPYLHRIYMVLADQMYVCVFVCICSWLHVLWCTPSKSFVQQLFLTTFFDSFWSVLKKFPFNSNP